MATIPTLPSLAAGLPVHAADLNNVANTCTFLLAKPIARIHDVTGGQAITTAFATVTYQTKDFDLDGIWPGAAHPERLVPQTPGWYKARYSVQIASSASAAQNYQTAILVQTGANNPLGSGVNLAKCLPGYGYQVSTGMTTYAAASGNIPYYLYVGDKVFVQIKGSTAAGTTGIDANMPLSYFSLEFVSA